MALDISTKKLKKNAFRVSKVRSIGASRIRVPGGCLDARVLGMVQEIAQTYGAGCAKTRCRAIRSSSWTPASPRPPRTPTTGTA